MVESQKILHSAMLDKVSSKKSYPLQSEFEKHAYTFDAADETSLQYISPETSTSASGHDDTVFNQHLEFKNENELHDDKASHRILHSEMLGAAKLTRSYP